MSFFSAMEENQISKTENGAKGFETSGSKLLDLNFRIPSFRDNGKIPFDLFQLSYEQEANLTLRWLLYLRDIKQGCGERDSFRKFLAYLCDHSPIIGSKFLNEFVKGDYGRWDDVIDIYFTIESEEVRHNIKNILVDQLYGDMDALHPSLLAKWLPSESSKNLTTRQRARELATEVFGCSYRVYRKTLSTLRKYVASTEVLSSAGKWKDILYQNVPSKANLKYRSAFLRHDQERRLNYLKSVSENKATINANAMFLHDIVLAYNLDSKHSDVTLETLWENQEKPINFADTLVVYDSSGSMTCNYVSNVQASIIASALTIYCAENNTGVYHDKFVTFSTKPKCVSFPEQSSLFRKLKQLRALHENCWSTNIEAVFDLILNTAVKTKAKAIDLPKNILIISDMEFDDAFNNSDDSTLFEVISKKFKEAGYRLPKLVFWNVCSRNNTVPMRENENGVILLSGFSKNLLTMVMSSELDPYKALVKMLSSERYNCIDRIYPL